MVHQFERYLPSAKASGLPVVRADKFGAAADGLELLEAAAGALWNAAAWAEVLALVGLLDMNALEEDELLLSCCCCCFEDCEVEIRLLCISL